MRLIDPSGDTNSSWINDVPPLPIGRYHSALVVVDGEILSIGGRAQNGTTTGDVYGWIPGAPQWYKLHNMPQKLSFFGTAVIPIFAQSSNFSIKAPVELSM